MPIQQSSYATPRADLAEALLEYDPSSERFIAAQALPELPVAKEAATLSVITRENLKRVDDRHANGAALNRVALAASDLAYACEDRGLEGQLTDRDRARYKSDFDAELETVQDVQLKILREQEARVAALLFNTSTWTGSDLFTDNSANPWSTTSTDIIGQVMDAKDKVRQNTGAVADALIIGAAALNNLLVNDDIIARFPNAAVISEEMLRQNLAAIFGLRYLLVGAAVYDSAAEGQDFSGSDIWSGTYAMVAKLQQGSLRQGGLGRIVRWDAFDSEGVLQYREEQTESDVFRVRRYQDEKVFDAYFAHLMQIEA